MQLSVRAASGDISLIETESREFRDNPPFPLSLPALRTSVGTLLDTLKQARKILATADNFLTVYPALAGFRQKQTYLVLLQNSAELRPTGGFIGTVGLLSVEDGQVTSFEVQDVYTIDGQLKGHVDPPIAIRELLAQEHWYLRDSNWDPDFSKSGQQALWFYEKITGNRPDGVIAISTPVVIGLLGITGPIQLPDYQETITKENFYSKALTYTQKDFFPGSTQKKDFLGTLTRALLTKLESTNTGDMIGVAHVVQEALQTHNLQVYVDAQEEQTLLTRFGWAGSVPSQSTCVDIHPCMFEPTGIFEANMSVNKANPFITRTRRDTVRFLENGHVERRVALAITNQAAVGSGNDYRTYLRVFLPGDALIGDLLLDDKRIPYKDQKRQATAQVPYRENEELTDAGKYVGVAFDIPPGSTHTLSIPFERSGQLEPGQLYELLFMRQGGVGEYRVTVGLSSELGGPIAQVVGDGRPFLANDGSIEYNIDLVTDGHLTIMVHK
jgi:hypothetical protein